ncbi:hypothetical protein CMMCAS08_02620 [Clavibacter michiganensis subsp. michiganensis]|uniref:hypothetical protein n=1 Tax=Clavibacter michiganensis TaxID=28447 RepID=UPI000B6E6F8C|nr:hypothetical protein [Clavibacter michiganensis]OUE05649.1 hypothetical protein CMMCAS08_02620 [Clavibacter michiganensis subsp. michiganensis]
MREQQSRPGSATGDAPCPMPACGSAAREAPFASPAAVNRPWKRSWLTPTAATRRHSDVRAPASAMAASDASASPNATTAHDGAAPPPASWKRAATNVAVVDAASPRITRWTRGGIGDGDGAGIDSECR